MLGHFLDCDFYNFLYRSGLVNFLNRFCSPYFIRKQPLNILQDRFGLYLLPENLRRDWTFDFNSSNIKMISNDQNSSFTTDKYYNIVYKHPNMFSFIYYIGILLMVTFIIIIHLQAYEIFLFKGYRLNWFVNVMNMERDLSFFLYKE